MSFAIFENATGISRSYNSYRQRVLLLGVFRPGVVTSFVNRVPIHFPSCIVSANCTVLSNNSCQFLEPSTAEEIGFLQQINAWGKKKKKRDRFLLCDLALLAQRDLVDEMLADFH